MEKENILLLGGAKASLFEAPSGTFKIKIWGIPQPPKNLLTQKDALALYNELNQTNYTDDLKEEPQGIPLLSSPIVGKFESESNPGSYHLTKRMSDGKLICTCTGWIIHQHCWHTDLLLEILQGVSWEVLVKNPIILTIDNIKELKHKSKEVV